MGRWYRCWYRIAWLTLLRSYRGYISTCWFAVNAGGKPKRARQPSLSNYDFSQRPNVGVQLAQGLGAVGQAIQQNEAAQRLSDFQKAFGQAYAAGDRDALRQLAATNPDQIETIRQGMGFVDADRNQAMGDMSARLNIAAAQGPEAVMRELATHQNTLQQIGVSPEQAWQTYQQSLKASRS